MPELDVDFKDVKNGKGFIIKIIFFIILFAGAGFGVFYYLNNQKSDKVSLKDNFFQSINYDLIKDARIPNYSNSWSYLLDASERLETKKGLILQGIFNDSDYKNEQMEILLELFEDYDERNNIGLKNFKPYFDMIDNSKTIEEFNKVLLNIEYDLNYNPFIIYSVQKDISDSSKNILIFQQAKMEDLYEVYALDKFKSYSEYYHKYRNKILKLYGYSDEKIQEVSKKIDDFILKIQTKTKELTEITDKTSLYKYYTIDDIKKDFHNLPILSLLTKFKVNDLEKYVFFDYEHYKYLDENYTLENLDTLKEMFKLYLLEEIVPLITTDEFLAASTELLNDVQGTNLTTEYYKIYIEEKLKSALVSDELNKRYEQLYFTDKNKKEIKEMIEDIKEYYKKIVNESKWLEEETKKEAIKKINSMKIVVGYQGQDESSYNLVSKKNGGSLLSNVILMDHKDIEDKFAKLKKESSSLSFDNLDLNAYYSLMDNSIIFPAAFYEVVNGEKDYYKLLGYIGFVIGHEISHGFDNTGSRLDELGQARDWWTKDDRAKYEEITKKIIDYYNGYSVQKVDVDGKKTLEENIADLAGMKAIVYIAEEKGATKEDYKKMFEAFATLWADKITKENLEKLKVTDVHAFNEVRVNAVLSSIDKFYEVYDIKENDEMFVASENRVGLW